MQETSPDLLPEQILLFPTFLFADPCPKLRYSMQEAVWCVTRAPRFKLLIIPDKSGDLGSMAPGMSNAGSPEQTWEFGVSR
jgi:hypothetical protein